MSNIKHSHDALNQIPKKPKKPASSFLRYLQSVRLELIKQNPSASLLGKVYFHISFVLKNIV